MTELEKTVRWMAVCLDSLGPMPHTIHTSGWMERHIKHLWIVNELNLELNKSFRWYANETSLNTYKISEQFNPFKSNPSADNKMKTEKKDPLNGLQTIHPFEEEWMKCFSIILINSISHPIHEKIWVLCEMRKWPIGSWTEIFHTFNELKTRDLIIKSEINQQNDAFTDW